MAPPGNKSWLHRGMRRFALGDIWPHQAGDLALTAPSSIVADPAADEEQVDVERPQRQRGRTTLTGDERWPPSATRWGQNSFAITDTEIDMWGQIHNTLPRSAGGRADPANAASGNSVPGNEVEALAGIAGCELGWAT